MKKMTSLICLLLLLSLLLTGCNAFAETQPEAAEETPANTPVETPAETEEELPYKVDGRFETTSDEMDYYVKLAKYTQIGDVGLKSPFDIRITEFYGEFNGSYVVELYVPGQISLDVVNTVKIGEYYFIYEPSDAVEVYNSADGKFYYLKSAYEQGLLTIEDIGVIYEQFVKLNAHMYDFDENGEVIPPKKTVVEIIDGYFYIDGVYTGIKAGSDTN